MMSEEASRRPSSLAASPRCSTNDDRAAIDLPGPGTNIEMSTITVTRALRNVLASLIGYPPVMHELLTRRLGG